MASMSASTPRRVLLVTYEFPPSAGGGVQRVAKFAKHLPSAGWRVDVLCAEPIPGRPRDDSLLEHALADRVVRLPARDVGVAIADALAPLKRLRSAARRPNGDPASDGGSRGAAGGERQVPLSTRLSRWIAVPDGAVLWSRRVPAAAAEMYAEEPFDAVLASGPPYSGVAAAARAAAALGVPFAADMRDAWIANPSVRWPTTWHARRSADAARQAIGGADAAVAVSEPIAAEARELGAPHALVLPNGYDPDDLPPRDPDPTGPLRLAFMGRLYHAADPETLLEGIALAVRSSADVLVDIVGPPSSVAESSAARLGIGSRVRFHGFRPHAEALRLVADADAALISFRPAPGVEGVYGGKLFEYLGLGVPIVLLGPPAGVAARLIQEARAGWVSPAGDAAALGELVSRLAAEKERGVLRTNPDVNVVRRYERRRQAAEVARLLDSLVDDRRGGERR